MKKYVKMLEIPHIKCKIMKIYKKIEISSYKSILEHVSKSVFFYIFFSECIQEVEQNIYV